MRGLKTQFGDFIVHENLDLDVREGEILGVVGGSGTGKSVLMRAIIGLKRPTAGKITVFAQNIMAPIREHLALPEALARDIAALKISMAGLPPDAGAKFPSELSGGMSKRAGLARALALDPELLFLDEPTAGLDPIGAARFDDLIVSLKKSLGLTVFMVTHDLDTLHAACDRVAVLAEKRVIAVGTTAEVPQTGHPWIEEYFGGPRGRAALEAKADQGGARGGAS